MSTRGDLYLRSKRTFWGRSFGQHFTIQHDAMPDTFLRVFKKAYAHHKETGTPIDNCLILQQANMFEANTDKESGFYANIDLIENHAKIGYSFCRQKELYFDGTIDELIAIEEWMLDSEPCFRVWGRRYTDSTFQYDVVGKDSAYSEGVSFFKYLGDNTSLGDFKKFLTSGQKCFTISLGKEENAYMALEKISKEEYISPEEMVVCEE